MKFSLVVLSPPSRPGASTALRFARAAVAGGHDIHRVFFFSEGVHNANALSVMPQDEVQLAQAWAAFAEAHGVDLVSCISAGIRRGLLNETESRRYSRAGHSLQPGFDLSGLGQWVDATLAADRTVVFG